MEKEHRALKLLAVLALLAAVVSASILLMPASFNHVNAESVSEIEIFSGRTGRSATVTDSETIARICDALGGCDLRVDGVSLGHMGYGLRVTIHGATGAQDFYVNSGDRARLDPFFYTARNGSIDFDYLNSLVEDV